jgi:hypothetical protein
LGTTQYPKYWRAQVSDARALCHGRFQLQFQYCSTLEFVLFSYVSAVQSISDPLVSGSEENTGFPLNLAGSHALDSGNYELMFGFALERFEMSFVGATCEAQRFYETDSKNQYENSLIFVHPHPTCITPISNA